MANLGCLPFYLLTSILILSITQLSFATDEDRQVYIVYMGALPQGEYSPSSHHVSLLQQTIDSSSLENPLVRSYQRSFNGFSAMLTEKEAEKLARSEDVVSVFPSKNYQLQTTRSWDFIGFNQTVSKGSSSHSDVIIGVIDTGIWPESESFNDEGFSAPPKSWKGSCSGGQNFTCNSKIVGARSYIGNAGNARDDEGHGTHTASTAAGNIVTGVSFYGLGNGTARGGAPSARIAAYKVCSSDGCSSESILAAFDDAIADGVDVITISIGSSSASEFAVDPIAIGGFHSAAKGILTLQSAGNNGPVPGTVSSVAPWKLSVAASSIDRQFIDKLVLGNGTTILGVSVNSFSLNGTKYPLVHGMNATSDDCDESSGALCLEGCLDSSKVKGKIVLCDEFKGTSEAVRAGAVGAIGMTEKPDVAFVVPLPAVGITSDKYEALKSYVSSTRSIDRQFIDKLVLGNGTTILGVSVNSFSLNGTKYPLVHGMNATSDDCDESSGALCLEGCLDSSKVKGKIVLCDEFKGTSEAVRAGAVGAIGMTEKPDVAFVVPLPAVGITSDKYEALKSYVSSTRNPTAEILKSETPMNSAAPVAASFSSRGPNTITPDILKPDVSAPGVDILAAYIPIVPPSPAPEDKRRVKYTVMSGTSMACPHAAGVAAYVKASHKNWSASAIQSAIITTATPFNFTKTPEAEFAYGAGQINPVKAVDPGLVYEASKADYINFLCGIGYDTARVRSISGDNSSCSSGAQKYLPRDLNYPTLTAALTPSETSVNITFHRTVTNVGAATATYKSSVPPNSKLKITVLPQVLSFKSLNERQSFTVSVSGTVDTSIPVSTSFVWSDGQHQVRSPIVVYKQSVI